MISDDWLGASRPRAIFITATGLALMLASAVIFAVFHSRIDERVAEGQVTQAEVVAVNEVGYGHFGAEELTLRYGVSGREYVVRVMPAWPVAPDVVDGTTVTVHVDPSNPRKVATSGGWVSEDRFVLVPSILGPLGIAAALLGGIGWYTSRWVKPRPRRVTIPGGDGESPVIFEFELPIARGGYGTNSVDTLLGQAVRARIENEPVALQRAAAAIRARSLPVERRGYDKLATDQYLAQFLRNIES